METEAGVGMRWPQAKECQGPPEAGRGKRDPPLELQGPATGWVWASGFQDWETRNSCGFKPPSPRDDHASDFLDGGWLGRGGAGV